MILRDNPIDLKAHARASVAPFYNCDDSLPALVVFGFGHLLYVTPGKFRSLLFAQRKSLALFPRRYIEQHRFPNPVTRELNASKISWIPSLIPGVVEKPPLLPFVYLARYRRMAQQILRPSFYK